MYRVTLKVYAKEKYLAAFDTKKIDTSRLVYKNVRENVTFRTKIKFCLRS